MNDSRVDAQLLLCTFWSFYSNTALNKFEVNNLKYCIGKGGSYKKELYIINHEKKKLLQGIQPRCYL